ncbi:MAG TPA: metallophosphoesterase [Symbiobacteriaceae bacterium]|nr:metallophosphoesterase [Symbiobacteriaceae bacterium]
MLTRRNLIKAVASILVTAAGGAAAWQVWRNRGVTGQAAPAELPGVLQNRQPLFSMFLLSDIHMSVDDSSMADKLKMALTDITRSGLPLDTIVLGGDLVDGGREQEYRRLKEVMSAYKLPPVYGNMGNHEYYDIWYNAKGDWSKETMPNDKTDAAARERFIRFMGYKDRPYHDVWINDVHLVMLSQETYVQERPEVGEGAWYSDAQLAWFEEVMRPHAGGKPALVFIHQPLPADGQDGGQHRVIRNKEFRAILKPYRNVMVFSGHTHRNLETEGRYVRDTTFHWFSNASVGKTRTTNALGAAVQGLYIQVHADQVVVLGREFSNRSWIQPAEWTVKLV